jgi:hypothetical protein
MQRAVSLPTSELELIACEIKKLRIPGRKLSLPEDLKCRLCKLYEAGVSLSVIRSATGVQGVSLKSWMKTSSRVEPRPFRVLQVVDAPPALEGMATFRYGEKKVTVDIPLAFLSAEIVKVLLQ